MLNKLIYGNSLILKPYLKALKNTLQDESQLRIQYLQGLVAQNTEQRETLTRLMAQGYIDQVLYSRENNGLLAQCEEFRSEIETLKKSRTTRAVQTAERQHWGIDYPDNTDQTLFGCDCISLFCCGRWKGHEYCRPAKSHRRLRRA